MDVNVKINRLEALHLERFAKTKVVYRDCPENCVRITYGARRTSALSGRHAAASQLISVRAGTVEQLQ